MKNLILESAEISGARKLLLKLQSDWDMSLIPAVKCKCKQERETDASYKYFPIAPKYRKVVGKGMMRFLLSDKDNIRRYLFDDCELGFKVKHDKKGKPIDCEVFIIKDDKEQ